MALPVYAADLPHETPDERIRNLRGYVLAVFQTSVLMETISILQMARKKMSCCIFTGHGFATLRPSRCRERS